MKIKPRVRLSCQSPSLEAIPQSARSGLVASGALQFRRDYARCIAKSVGLCVWRALGFFRLFDWRPRR